MANYKYLAKTMEGKTRKGTMEAVDEKTLQQLLREQELYLVRARNLGRERRRRKLSAKLLADFCREMSGLMASGVTMVRALDIVAEEEGQPEYVREIIRELTTQVKRGVSLSEAMADCGCFSDLMVGMIRSGEGNGNLDVVMGRLAVQYDRENRLNHQVKSAMTYPGVLLVLCIVVVGIIVAVVMPQFDELFAEMESLPLVTELLLSVSNFLSDFWYLVILGVILLGIALRVLGRVPVIRRRVDRWKVHFPVVGRLNKIIYTARLARTLSSLYSSGMPIAYALRTAGETIGNVYVEEQLGPAASKVRSGIPLSQALSQVDGLLKKLSSTVMVGEESGRLDVMLTAIADNMEEEAQEASKRLVTLLEPVMIALMALMIGFVVVAVMLPIYQSYGAIEGTSPY